MTDNKRPRLTVDMLSRIAQSLERLSPPPAPAPDLGAAEGFLWRPEDEMLEPVTRINRIPLELLKGIDRIRETLLLNTRQFANGLPANNALLWGARGMGKSSLIKAVHARINSECEESARVALVEIHRDDVPTLDRLLSVLRGRRRRVILFCDDLSFDTGDSGYKSLKAVLEGGIEGRPENVLFYATSNRRHLLPRDMMENERGSAISPADVVDEKVSLSDRFGLWLGFHACNQNDYLAMIDGYAVHYGLDIATGDLRAKALEWAVVRGARSGRVAWQFIQDLAGKLGARLDP
ncbi:MAG: ATP-binding protein [Sphingomonadales bacterium]